MDETASSPADGFVPLDVDEDFSQALGAVYINRTQQRLGFRVTLKQGNPVNSCHGGALATLADLQLLALRQESDAHEPHSPTISLSLDYLAPVPIGAWVEAHVTLARETRSLIFTQANIFVEGHPVARALAIYHNRLHRN